MSSPYEPPSSRPASGGLAPQVKSRLWLGFKVGWISIALTFLWAFVALPMANSMGLGNSAAAGIVFLVVLFAPVLAVLGYFGVGRDWRALSGVLLAVASGIAALLLLVAACVGILGMNGGF